MTVAAAVVFAVAVAGIIAFQIALALGAPLGAYAMGGQFQGRYPPAMRVAAVGQALLLALAGLIVLSSAGLVAPSVAEAFPWLIWLVVALSGVSVVLNAITPSAGERRIWAPVAIVMLVSSLTVAISP